MKYCILSPQYKLRGWIGFPHALVHEGNVKRLSRDEFNTLLICDGQTDTETIKQKQMLDTLRSFEEKGIVRFCDHPEELENPPGQVRFEQGVEYHVPKIKKN